MPDENYAILTETLIYARISDRAFRLHAIILRHCYGTQTCQTSINILAKKLRADWRTCMLKLKELEQAGFLDILEKHNPDTHKTRYVIRLKKYSANIPDDVGILLHSHLNTEVKQTEGVQAVHQKGFSSLASTSSGTSPELILDISKDTRESRISLPPKEDSILDKELPEIYGVLQKLDYDVGKYQDGIRRQIEKFTRLSWKPNLDILPAIVAWFRNGGWPPSAGENPVDLLSHLKHTEEGEFKEYVSPEARKEQHAKARAKTVKDKADQQARHKANPGNAMPPGFMDGLANANPAASKLKAISKARAEIPKQPKTAELSDDEITRRQEVIDQVLNNLPTEDKAQDG